MKSITLRSMNSLPIVKDIQIDKITRLNSNSTQLHGRWLVKINEAGKLLRNSDERKIFF